MVPQLLKLHSQGVLADSSYNHQPLLSLVLVSITAARHYCNPPGNSVCVCCAW